MKTTALKFAAIAACTATLVFAGEAPAQTRYEAVHTFSGNRGRPHGALAQGADGRLYGTTISGGFFGKGSVFATDGGTSLTTIHEFDGSDGEAPRGQLVLGSDSALYGTTTGGNGFGTIFRIAADGTFATLVHFDGANGAKPQAALVQASDGSFYGTTLEGGASGNGTIFRMTPAGALTTLISFAGADGAFPRGSLVEDGGFLYGTTQQGGAANLGTLFRLSLDGTLETIASFDGSKGAQPSGGLALAGDGSLYGTTEIGGSGACGENGATGCGTIYRLLGGVLETVHSFSALDGSHPNGDLRELNGQIYGTTFDGGANGLGTVFRLESDGTFVSLAQFAGDGGFFPRSGLVQAANGSIFGTTESGGPGTFGTVYELMPDDSLRFAVSFTGTGGADPSSRLLQASDGNFYGTTTTGGEFGFGTVFRMSPEGVVTTVVSFDGTNGSFPSGGMVQAMDGDLYGTTEAGGATLDGTVFRLSPTTGAFTSMSLDFFVSGTVPSGRLIEGSDGKLYGTALFHADGAGVVFRVDREAQTIEAAGILPLDESLGSFPTSGVVEGPDGRFYGTAEGGGASGLGAVFSVTPDGQVDVMASFNDVDGAVPASPLLLANDGNLYGTTAMGGDTGDGTLFRIAPDGALTSLASFDFSNGSYPYQQGVVELNGAIYGTATSGGAHAFGVVYRWSADEGLSAVHEFDGSSGDGPNTTLAVANDGSLFGTTFGPQGGVVYRLSFENAAASLSVAPGSAIYGGSATLAATLTASGAPLASAEIAFSLNGVPVGTAVTDAGGLASLLNVSVAGLDAGSNPGAIAATFAGTGSIPGAAGQGDLTITRAVPTIAMNDASYVYDGLPHAAVASLTGVGGATLAPLTFTYNGGAAAPIEPGSYAVIASYEGSTNYEAASATATITISPAAAGLNGLVAAYAFEEGSGRLAGDASGRGHAGRIKRSQWVANGRFGGALDFDGVNDWVTVADEADLNMQAAITIEAWVKPRSLSGWNTIVLKEGDGRMAYALYANDSVPRPAGYVRVNFVDQSAAGRNPLPLNAWTHVAMTYSGTVVRLYVNGAEAGRRSVSGKIQSTNGPLRIGGNAIWGEFFNGTIDEVRIYKRELSVSEIARDMNTPIAHEAVPPTVAITSPANGATLSGLPSVSVSASDNFALSNVRLQVDGVDLAQEPGGSTVTFTLDAANGPHVLTAVAQDAAGNTTTSAPVQITIANAAVADYRFDEGTGATVVDSSGRNNTGSISGGVTRVNDAARGRVLSFNGLDGLVTVADSPSLDIAGAVTLEAWVRPTAVDTWRNVIMKERGTGLSYALYSSDDARKPSGYVRIASVDQAVEGPSRLPGSTWSHIAMTYDGAFMRLFVNGVEVERRRESGAINVSNGKLRIGGNKNWGEYFKGQIDDVVIYGVAVGEAQIKADMNR